MRNKTALALLVVVAIAATLTSTGCRRVRLEDVEGPTGLAVEQKSVALEGAEKLDVRVRMAAGQLTLAGGAAGAMDATFESSPRTWVPDVTYSVEGTQAALRVTQPDVRDLEFFGDKHNEWDIKLASGVPVDLETEFGAGDTTLDLREVDVRDLLVQFGAGEATVDLSGDRTSDVVADIQGGVGELTLRVPQDVGVRISGSRDGVGDYDIGEGFTADGDDYVNDAWATSPVKIQVRLERGVGQVNVEQVP